MTSNRGPTDAQTAFMYYPRLNAEVVLQLATQRQRLLRTAIDRLPVTTYHAMAGPDTDSCVICLDDYGQGATVRTLACGHAFHVACIDTWLERKDTCPLCKASIITDSAARAQLSASPAVVLVCRCAPCAAPSGCYSWVSPVP